MKTLLIDGDALIYQVAFSSEKSTNWAEAGRPEIWTMWANEDEGWYRVCAAIEAMKERHEADEAIMCLSDEANFRVSVLPTYKGNRREVHRPLLHGILRERTINELRHMMKPGLEADDIMGIVATAGNRIVKGEKLIVTDDKDLKTIPAPQVHLDGHADDVFCPTVEGADRFFLYQTLIGDTTDNYGGCPGMGPKSADKVLAKFDGDVYKAFKELVVPAYEKKGLSEDDALVQARCARILRFEDYDAKKLEVRLWTP